MKSHEVFGLPVAEGDMMLERLGACVAAFPDNTHICYYEDSVSLSFLEFKGRFPPLIITECFNKPKYALEALRGLWLRADNTWACA